MVDSKRYKVIVSDRAKRMSGIISKRFQTNAANNIDYRGGRADESGSK